MVSMLCVLLLSSSVHIEVYVPAELHSFNSGKVYSSYVPAVNSLCEEATMLSRRGDGCH